MVDSIIQTKKIILALGDIFCLYLGLFFTLALRYGIGNAADQWPRHFWPFTIVFVLWLIIFYIGELYEVKSNFNTSTLFSSLIKIFIANGILAVIIFYFLSPLFSAYIKPQTVLIINIAVTLILIFAWRRLFFLLFKSSKMSTKTLIIGGGKLSEEVLREIKNKPHLGYEAVFENDIPDNLKEYCLNNKINLVISAIDIHKNAEASKKLFDCVSLGLDVLNINRFYEKITHKIPVEDIEHGWFLENLSSRPNLIYDAPKRAMDILLAGIAGIISLVFYPFIYLAIKLDDGGAIFSVQGRIGKNNQIVRLLKFRTMKFANDSFSQKELDSQGNKIENSVTKIGKFLRKTRLDELPQLWNVLKGDLSLIGPRPEFPNPVQLYTNDIPYYSIRHVIKPGLSGWAQINQDGEPHHGIDINETRTKFSYDLYYIKNRSFLLDISIALKTIKTLIMRKGV